MRTPGVTVKAGRDIVIIGAGPAGLAAAIQLRRQGFDPVVFEDGSAGGLLRNAGRIENYPGVPGGVPGWDLAETMLRQASALGVRVSRSAVDRLGWFDRSFVVRTGDEERTAAAVIVASGTVAVPWCPAEGAAPPEGILHEIVPLKDAESKRVAVIGGGDAAYDYALTLARRNEVLVVQRAAQARCLGLLRDRVAADGRIRVVSKSEIRSVERDSGGAFRLRVRSPEGDLELFVDHVVAAVGRSPRLDFLDGTLRDGRNDLERRGRLHFAGDVVSGRHRQTAIAVGDGVRAAMRAAAALEEEACE